MSIRAVAVSIVAALGIVGGAGVSPAIAESGSITVGDGVLYECADHPYTYSLDLPEDTESWSMDVTVRSEDGLEATSDYVYDQPGLAGTSEFQLCPSDGPGAYTLNATVAYYNSDYDRSTIDLPVAIFAMRLPMTRTAMTAAVRPNRPKKLKVVVLRTRTTDERPNGYFQTSYPDVVIEYQQAGAWRTLPNVDVSPGRDGKGVARFTWPIGKQAILRAHTVPEDWDDYTESFSESISVR
jgi:hypothetical protein